MADQAALFAPFRAPHGLVVVMSDFDGTLAAIVDEPEGAVPVRGAVDALAALAERVRVGVISGRPLAFLERFIEADQVRLAGTYGLEERIDGSRVEHPEAEQWRSI